MMLGCLFFFFTKMFSWKCHHDISDIIRSLVGARKEMNIQQKTNENNNTIDSKYFRFLVFLHFSCCHQITTNNNCNNDVFVGTATTMSTSLDIKSLIKENVPLSQEKKNKKKTCISFILAKHLRAKHTLNIRLQSSLQQSRAKLLPLWNTHLSLQLSISSTANLYFLIQKVNASILKYHIYSCIMQLLKTSFWS